jgi:hypothetical protein
MSRRYSSLLAGALDMRLLLSSARIQSGMDAELMRMKRMIETGVPPHDAARKDQSVHMH